jgi:hypothetical protein
MSVFEYNRKSTHQAGGLATQLGPVELIGQGPKPVAAVFHAAGPFVEVEMRIQRVDSTTVAVGGTGNQQTLGFAPAEVPEKIPVLAELAKDGVHGVGQATGEIREAGHYQDALPVPLPAPDTLVSLDDLVERTGRPGAGVMFRDLGLQLSMEDGEIGAPSPGDPERADQVVVTLDGGVLVGGQATSQVGGALATVSVGLKGVLQKKNGKQESI